MSVQSISPGLTNSFSELELHMVQNMHSSSKILTALQRFVKSNSDPKYSQNYKSTKTDSPKVLLEVLDLYRDQPDIIIQTLKVLKILARKVRITTGNFQRGLETKQR